MIELAQPDPTKRSKPALWREIPSTGEWYTVEACPHLGGPWLYAYLVAERPA